MVLPRTGTLKFFGSAYFFLSSQLQTATILSLKDPLGTNFLSNKALPIVKPQALKFAHLFQAFIGINGAGRNEGDRGGCYHGSQQGRHVSHVAVGK